ncbi:putative quinone-oxidoreductase-like protein [Nymphaea thermarum]|nr:putative quinone-oxidoreductase-like protein [Nymphaea thermarum]
MNQNYPRCRARATVGRTLTPPLPLQALTKAGGLKLEARSYNVPNVGPVKSLGADQVLDYTIPEGAALGSPLGRNYDVVIHCAPATPWHTSEPVLTESGMLIELTPEMVQPPSHFQGKRSVTYSPKKIKSSTQPLIPIPYRVSYSALRCGSHCTSNCLSMAPSFAAQQRVGTSGIQKRSWSPARPCLVSSGQPP